MWEEQSVLAGSKLQHVRLAILGEMLGLGCDLTGSVGPLIYLLFLL